MMVPFEFRSKVFRQVMIESFDRPFGEASKVISDAAEALLKHADASPAELREFLAILKSDFEGAVRTQETLPATVNARLQVALEEIRRQEARLGVA